MCAAAPALLKVVLTPGLIAIATLLARRWGPGLGGAVVGLPLTSAPVSMFLALEQGPAFAATAAVATLLGLLAQAALCLAYSWTAPRAPWWTSAAAGVAAFLGTTVVLTQLILSAWPAFALVCGLLVLSSLMLPAPAMSVATVRTPGWDLPLRMLVATLVVLTLTMIAPHLGPTWTGLLSPFPVFALVLAAFTHRAQGARAAASLLRGVVLGSLAHATMFALIASLVVAGGLVWTYTCASVSAIAVSGAAIALARKTSLR